MNNLIEDIKKNCINGYFDRDDNKYAQAAFNHDQDSDLFYYLCAYLEDHYSRWNIFLPKIFRNWMHDKNGFRKRDEPFQLFILHYYTNYKAIKNKLAKIAEIYENKKEWKPETQSIDQKKILSWLEDRRPTTAVSFLFSGTGRRVDVPLPTITGSKVILENFIKILKQDPKKTFEYLTQLHYSNEDITWIEKHTKIIQICDLVSRPREIYFQRSLPSGSPDSL